MSEFSTGEQSGELNLETVLQRCNISKEEWEIVKFHVSLSSEDKWWAKLECKSKLSPLDYSEIAESIQKWSPKRSFKYDNTSPEIVLEVGIFDLHLGSIVVNEGYETRLLDSLDRLAHRSSLASRKGIVILPIAGDIFHADNEKLTTTKGTFVGDEFYGLWNEVVQQGFSYLAKVVVYLSGIAPVEVVVVPGNHDKQTSFSLGLFLDAYFSGDENVTVDSDMRTIKYKAIGKTLVGFMHGDIYRKQSAVSLLANDVPEMWAQSEFREIHHGHYHREEVREENGVILRCIPALSPTGWWEGNAGYRRQAPSLRGHEYDMELGIRTILNEWI